MGLLSGKEVAKSVRSLICFLQALKGRRVVIEMRNDAFITGILQSVDAWMNVELSSAYIWSIYKQLETMNLESYKESEQRPVVEISTQPDMDYINKHPPELDYIFIKGCRIRYFNVPDDVNIRVTIEAEVGRYQRRAGGGDACLKPFNWKSYRKKLKEEAILPRTVATKDVISTTSTLTSM